MRRLLLALTTCAAAVAALAPAAQASKSMESMFQDDNLLVFNSPQGTAHTMDVLKALGVDRIRVSVFWRVVAPDAGNPKKPNFDASDPAAYPPGAWDRYDRIVEMAAQRGLQVNFNPTSPAPNWATGTSPDRPDIDQTYDPNATEFNLFMRALGKRYSGTYVPQVAGPPAPARTSLLRQGPQASVPGALPRVSYWSIWNEPNQPGWLTPQYGKDPRGAGWVETSPRIYRDLVDGAYDGLVATGHGNDTILVGETAPKGVSKQGETRAISPEKFLRQVYCLDDNNQFLQGTSAELRGCPVSDQAAKFTAAHPGLFRMTGFSHHPYELIFAPDVKPKRAGDITIANLSTLEKLLRRVFQRYGQPLPGGGTSVPLYLTEFGYQTNPPDPTAVSPTKQAAYINQAEYIAWRDPNVRTLSQFLLVDDKPRKGVKGNDKWITFQSGLINYKDLSHKPAYSAYEMPIFVADRRVRRGRSFRVWGGVRIAPPGMQPRISIQVRGPKKGSRYKRIRSATGEPSHGYINARIKPKRSGRVRLAWYDARQKRTLHSRSVPFTIVQKKKHHRR
jgi:hypothetical protein